MVFSLTSSPRSGPSRFPGHRQSEPSALIHAWWIQGEFNFLTFVLLGLPLSAILIIVLWLGFCTM